MTKKPKSKSIKIKSKSTKKKNDLEVENMKQFLDKCLDEMKKKQKKMIEKYNFGFKSNKLIFFPDKKKFYLYNKKTLKTSLEANFQIIGTYANISNTWRFAWANRHVPHDLKKASLKIKEFGKSNNLDLFDEPKIKDESLGLIFTALSLKLSHGKGFYKIPAEEGYPEVYIMFTKLKKIKKSIVNIVKNIEKNNIKTKKKYTKMLGGAFR
tara:strand:+ start:540 stop:1169 length:630 start_codon:yes stop_codon:yes gene_type:complete